MELNSVIFPSPSISHDIDQYCEEIIYIPKFKKEDLNEKSTSFSFSSSVKESLDSEKDKEKKTNDKSNSFNKYEKNIDSDSLIGYIPCLLLQAKKKNLLSRNFMIYFHGNAEDIFFAREIADRIRLNLPVRIYL